MPAIVYGPVTVGSPVADPNSRKNGSQKTGPLPPVVSMPSAYQPSPKFDVGLPVPDTPVSVSRLVMPLAPKLIERSLPVRVTFAVVPAPNRLTLPLGELAEGVPSPYHNSSRYDDLLVAVVLLSSVDRAVRSVLDEVVWLKSTSRYSMNDRSAMPFSTTRLSTASEAL